MTTIVYTCIYINGDSFSSFANHMPVHVHNLQT